MRLTSTYAVVLAAVAGANALETLSEYISDIPKCSLDALKKAFADYPECPTDGGPGTFDCLCKHAGALAISVSKDVEVTCVSDFTQAVGSACGLWLAQSTSATGYPQASKALASDLGGKGGSDSKPTATGSSDPSATVAAASSTSKALGAVITPLPYGLAGGAAAALAALLI